MKWQLIILMGVFIGIMGSINAFDWTTSDSGYWKLNENNLSDSVQNITTVNTGTTNGTGKISSGRDFVGASNQYINVSDHADLNFSTGALSINFWVNLTNGVAGAGNGFITKDDVGTNGWGIVLSGVPVAPAIATGDTEILNGITPINNGAWHMVTWTRSSGGNNTIYVDSVQKATVSNSADLNNIQKLRIGKWFATAGLTGDMDEIGIWKGRVLTGSEINELYNSGSGLPYSVDSISPLWYNNQTNQTTAGTPIIHSVNWTDETGLSSYIFSYCNGSYNQTVLTNNVQIYNFSNTTNNKAYKNNPLVSNRWTNGAQVNATEYTWLAVNEGSLVNTPNPSTSTNDYPIIRFNFTVNEPVANIFWLNMTFRGFDNATEVGSIYIWNYTLNNWLTVGVTPAANGYVTFNFTGGNISNLINGGKQVYVVVEGALYDAPDAIMTDYIAISLGYSTTSYNTGVCYEASPIFTNETSASMTGVSNFSNVTLIANATVGSTIKWRVYANDGSNTNVTPIFTYNTTAVSDTSSPQWSSNSTNSTVAGSLVNHTVLWTDSALSNYTFSFDNGTGTFVNDSVATMNGTSNQSWSVQKVNQTVGSYMRWQVYAWDITGNSNVTMIFGYNVTSATSCTYTSGDWNINLADNCVITTVVNIYPNRLVATGTGSLIISGGEIIAKERHFISTSYTFGRTNGGKLTLKP